MTRDDRAMAERIGRLCGVAVAWMRSVPGAVTNRNYLVRLTDGTRLVAKFGPSDQLHAEAWVCRELSSLAVAVPAVVALDAEGPGNPGCLVMAFADGTASDDPSVVRQAGALFRTVHGLRLDGWGPLIADAAGARGRHASWSDFVHAQLAGLDDLVRADVLPADLAERAREAVLVPEVLGDPGPGVLLHNDLKAAHLFAVHRGGRAVVASVIDWGAAGVGDPLADVARLSMMGPDALAAFAAGYGLSLTPLVLERLARYRIAWNVETLTCELRAGGDWFEAYRSWIVDDLALLRASSRC